jgi:hypothetical protein
MARQAKCVANLDVNVVGTMRDGTQRSVRIGPGWEGDLDQVVGETVTPAKRDPDDDTKILEPEKIVPVTLLEALGDRYNLDVHFEVAKAKKPQPAPAAPQN